MKEIKEEIKREIKETLTFFEAVDGTRFQDKEECRKYEDTARCILRTRLKELEVWRGNEWDLLKGCDDHDVIALQLQSQEDVDTVMQAFLIDNPYYLKDGDERTQKWLEERKDMAEKAYKENDLLLMGLNCDDDLYFFDTRNGFIERLNNLDKKE